MRRAFAGIAIACAVTFATVALATAPQAAADARCPTAEAPAQSGGVYVLSTPGNLQWVKDANVSGTNAQWGYSYRMNRDIDMGGCTWDSVIGGVAPFFTGSFNGAGYLISGLTIAVNVTGGTTTASYVGLFGRTEAGSVIENVGFHGSVSATINQVVLLGGVSHTLEIGALIGGSRGGTVRQSFTTGNVTGSVRVRSGNSSATAPATNTVNATGLAGGLIGRSESIISDSFATGTVNITAGATSDLGNAQSTTSAVIRTGGLIGNGVAGSTTRSYSTGSVDFTLSFSTVGGNGSSSGNSAGAIGVNDAPVTVSAWNTTTSREVDGIRTGTQTGGFSGLTTTEMQDVASFGSAGLNWDIAGDCALTGVWSSCATRNEGFPTLSIFSLANRSGDDPGQAPPPIIQQVGLLPGQGCGDVDIPSLNWAGVGSGGWGQSWAEWAVPFTGGAVCTRELYYDSPRSRWAVRT